MAIKAVDPIADLSLAREVKLRDAQAARRNSQRPEPPHEAPAVAVFPQQASAQETEQAQAEQRQQEEANAQAQGNPQNPSLRFHVDPDTGKTVAELVDHQGQVLRQMPTEEALEIAKAIGKMQGMFVDLKV
ncbi:MAG TPA: flagellar protein FlaG [Polyangiales bacterium]|nr:flagellar protein FlaG [Polyangiales bacterium]